MDDGSLSETFKPKKENPDIQRRRFPEFSEERLSF